MAPCFSGLKVTYLDRYQRVTIDGADSGWERIEAGVPQGSVLGTLLFFIYINDTPDTVASTCFLFADDTLLMDKVCSYYECWEE